MSVSTPSRLLPACEAQQASAKLAWRAALLRGCEHFLLIAYLPGCAEWQRLSEYFCAFFAKAPGHVLRSFIQPTDDDKSNAQYYFSVSFMTYDT